jgi:hypothetical protein
MRKAEIYALRPVKKCTKNCHKSYNSLSLMHFTVRSLVESGKSYTVFGFIVVVVAILFDFALGEESIEPNRTACCVLCGVVLIIEKIFSFFLARFMQNLKDQILTTNIWLEHEWQDHKFKWDPLEYGGVTELYVPSEHIW